MKALNWTLKVLACLLIAVALTYALVDFVRWCSAPNVYPDGRATIRRADGGDGPGMKIGDSVYYDGRWWKVVRMEADSQLCSFGERRRYYELLIDDGIDPSQTTQTGDKK